jgi:hypothetical protein
LSRKKESQKAKISKNQPDNYLKLSGADIKKNGGFLDFSRNPKKKLIKSILINMKDKSGEDEINNHSAFYQLLEIKSHPT